MLTAVLVGLAAAGAYEGVSASHGTLAKYEAHLARAALIDPADTHEAVRYIEEGLVLSECVTRKFGVEDGDLMLTQAAARALRLTAQRAHFDAVAAVADQQTLTLDEAAVDDCVVGVSRAHE